MRPAFERGGHPFRPYPHAVAHTFTVAREKAGANTTAEGYPVVDPQALAYSENFAHTVSDTIAQAIIDSETFPNSKTFRFG